jgi:hypothetical protein
MLERLKSGLKASRVTSWEERKTRKKWNVKYLFVLVLIFSGVHILELSISKKIIDCVGVMIKKCSELSLNYEINVLCELFTIVNYLAL